MNSSEKWKNHIFKMNEVFSRFENYYNHCQFDFDCEIVLSDKTFAMWFNEMPFKQKQIYYKEAALSRRPLKETSIEVRLKVFSELYKLQQAMEEKASNLLTLFS